MIMTTLIKMEEKYKISNLTLYLKEVEEVNNLTPKLAEGRK